MKWNHSQENEEKRTRNEDNGRGKLQCQYCKDTQGRIEERRLLRDVRIVRVRDCHIHETITRDDHTEKHFTQQTRLIP